MKSATRYRRPAVAVGCLAIASVALAAPTPWDPAVGGNGHLYDAVRVGSPISWDTARARARARGSGWDLATITSREENEFVKGLFTDKPWYFSQWSDSFDPAFPYRAGPWIGGFRDSGGFKWVTGEPFLFRDFAFGPGTGSKVAYAEQIGPVAWRMMDGSTGTRLAPAPITYIAEYAEPTGETLTLKSLVVPGCKDVIAKLALAQPAPPEGLVVTISDTLGSASGPATVNVAPGAMTKTFTIRTTPVATSETGVVRATVRNRTLSEQLTVRPIGLSSLTLASSTVVGGRTVSGKATLECTAALGPITVDLGSNKNWVAHPVAPAVVVSQGLRWVSFDVATNPVVNKTSVAITGTANGFSKSKSLNVSTAASVTPTALRFGNVVVGDTSPMLNVELWNKGTVPYAVFGIQLTGVAAARFTLDTACPANLAAGGSCTIGVRFSPSVTGLKTATLRIDTSARLADIVVPVTGTGVATP